MGPSDFHIGYVGRLVPEKGIDLLIRAAAQLDGNWALSIIGTGPEKASLMCLVDTLGCERRVRFHGSLQHHALRKALASLDVLVSPSRTRPNWKEQFGRVLIEAMACRVAVIGSSSGEIPVVIGDAGLVFREDDVNDLKRCLESLQRDIGLRDKLAELGYRRVQANYTGSISRAAPSRCTGPQLSSGGGFDVNVFR